MVTRRLILTLVVAMAGCSRPAPANAQRGAAPQGTATASRAIDAQRHTAIVDASARVAPAVVSIHTVLPVARQWSFLGVQEETPQGFGTGFIFRADGHIITNQHVVENAKQIIVTLADGTDADATLVGEDPVTDIAVLKITSRPGLPVVTFGKSDDLMTGEWAIALGNPYAYLLGNSEPTVTAGVISATHRNIMSSGHMQGVYVGMIQTDAAINPGNSGGPLVNALGEVIGVNSSIFSNTGESVGLGFSIPIERAIRVANELIASHTVRRAWPGLEIVISGNLTEHRTGVQVRSVAPDGPADRAGIRPGDVLLSANGRPLRTYLDWEAVKLDLQVGEAITVGIRGPTGTVNHRIVTGDLPTLTAARVQVLKGMDLVTVTPAVRAERNVTNQFGGALVVKIQSDIESQTGIQRGDVIYGIDNKPLKSADEVADALKAVRGGQQFNLYLERQGQRLTIPLRMNP